MSELLNLEIKALFNKEKKMKNRWILSGLFVLLVTFNLSGQNIKFTEEVFKDWIQTRVGDGSSPSFWSCTGEV